jgi:signal peptidase I
MWNRSPARSVPGLLLGLALLAGIWVALAPAGLGGSVVYVTAIGTSMAPGIHRGDLVLVRRAAAYGVGDVVAYRSPTLGIVLHRIVGREGERFVLRGDNNHWLDADQPTADAIVGRRWLRLPRVGALLSHLHAPPYAAVLAGLLGVFAMMPDGPPPSRRRSRSGAGADPAGGRGWQSRRRWESVAAGAAVLGVVALLIAAVAFRRPTTTATTTSVTYEHRGTFAYTAAAAPGVTDRGETTTGEPVFLRLAETMTVRFAYRFSTSAAHDIGGTISLRAQISQDNGWRRTLVLMAETPFQGASAAAEGTIDLRRVRALIAALEEETGVHSTRPYRLTLLPEVTVRGVLAGQDLQDRWAPSLPFALDPLQLQLDRAAIPAPAGTGGGSAADPARTANAFEPSRSAAVQVPAAAPARFHLLGTTVTVSAVRTVALAALALAAVVALGAGIGWWRSRYAGEPARIADRYGHLLVTVDADPVRADSGVAVAHIDDLVRIAQQSQRPILHWAARDGHAYAVLDEQLAYVFRVPATGGAAAGPENGRRDVAA